jgi:beta-1,4-N-acetylglucosaminyltransferase
VQKLPKMFYIESFCRTFSLSASGKILYHLRLMDDFFVMWPKVHELYPRAKYTGFTI